jgi:predicted transcriptional regulator
VTVLRATMARATAGLSLGEAAKCARISIPYLRQVEREGANYSLTSRLSAIYGCPLETLKQEK